MVVVELPKAGIGFRVQKKIGRPLLYGLRVYGAYQYGEQEPDFCPTPYGVRVYGTFPYGEQILQWGIFQVAHGKDWRTTYRREFFYPNPSQTEAQLIQRQKFADGIVAWHALTDEERIAYNEGAKFKNLYGYNVFLKEYLSSH